MLLSTAYPLLDPNQDVLCGCETRGAARRVACRSSRLLATRVGAVCPPRAVLRAAARASMRACWRSRSALSALSAPSRCALFSMLGRTAPGCLLRQLAVAEATGLITNSKLGLCASGMDACSAHSEPLSWRPQACPRGARFSAPSTASLVRVTLLQQTSAENG